MKCSTRRPSSEARKLGVAFEEVRDPVTAEPEKLYDLAGVRWWGAGVRP